MSFHEDSQMPEHKQGYDESAVTTQVRIDDVQPSVQATDRFGLERAGKGYLTRKYNIQISGAGNPYFTPIDSLLNSYVQDADAALAEARARLEGSEELQARANKLANAAIPYFEAQLEDAGEDRAWVARSNVIWPLTDKVGFQLYKATSGEADLVDFGAYLARTDANIKSAMDLQDNERYVKRQFWTDLAYDELAVLDSVIRQVDPDSAHYNLTAIIANGYRSAAQLDTKQHLRGVQENAPVTSDTPQEDLKAQIMASRRVASAS